MLQRVVGVKAKRVTAEGGGEAGAERAVADAVPKTALRVRVIGRVIPLGQVTRWAGRRWVDDGELVEGEPALTAGRSGDGLMIGVARPAERGQRLAGAVGRDRQHSI